MEELPEQEKGRRNAGNGGESRGDEDRRSRGYPTVADRCGTANNEVSDDRGRGNSRRVETVVDTGEGGVDYVAKSGDGVERGDTRMGVRLSSWFMEKNRQWGE